MHDLDIVQLCNPYTMTSTERLLQTIWAVDRVLSKNIEGDLVEVGVWRGGSVLAMLLTLLRAGQSRDVHLYDTFRGMTPPTEEDVDFNGEKASDIFEAVKCEASLDVVRKTMQIAIDAGYPASRIFYHEGDVRDATPPQKIAVLRVDCDWHDLVAHTLREFEPAVAAGGIVTIDDAGHWRGARKAMDAHMAGRHEDIVPIDYTGVFWVKK